MQDYSVQSLSHVQLFGTPWITAHRPPCPSPTSTVYSKPCPLSQWCHPTISSSSSPSPALNLSQHQGLFQISQLFASGGQSIGASASASVLPVNIQDRFPLGLTCLISLQSKGLSRVFSRITVWKHQFFCSQPFLWSNSHIHTWLLKNHSLDYMDLCQQSNASAF